MNSWKKSPLKCKLIIGNHNLDCTNGIFEARYRDIQSNRFDAIHLFGLSGIKVYSASVINILSSAKLVCTTPPKYYDQFEHKWLQAKYVAQQKNRISGRKDYTDSGTDDYNYTVPTSNKYGSLGDYNDYYQGNY